MVTSEKWTLEVDCWLVTSSTRAYDTMVLDRN